MQKAGDWVTGGGLMAAAVAELAFGADWKTVLAIGGLALTSAAVFGAAWLVMRWIKGDFRQINADARQ